MKKIISMILALAMVLVCGCAMAETADNSLQAIIDKGELILGLDDTFPPMGFRDDDNNIVGYDIDLATEVCARLNVKLVCQPIDWSAKELELSEGNIDCIWNGMSITDERKEAMAMTEAYMNNKIVVVAKNDSGIASVADLAGKTVAVQGGSFAEEVFETYEDYADEYASVKEVLAYDEYLTALMDLQQGGVDAVLIDLIVAEYRIAGLEDDTLVVVAELEDDLYGIGFRKADVALRDKVWEILNDMAEDGTMAKISEKWFGKDISVVGAVEEAAAE